VAAHEAPVRAFLAVALVSGCTSVLDRLVRARGFVDAGAFGGLVTCAASGPSSSLASVGTAGRVDALRARFVAGACRRA